MAVNPALEGRTFAPVGPYLVGREKVREFASAVQAGSPIGVDPDAARAAGYADIVAAPTFPIVIGDLTLRQLLAEPDTGIDFALVVHGDQRFEFVRPIVAGDELTAQQTVTSVKTLGGNSMVTSSTLVTDAAGSPVVTATSTLVVRAAA